MQSEYVAELPSSSSRGASGVGATPTWSICRMNLSWNGRILWRIPRTGQSENRPCFYTSRDFVRSTTITGDTRVDDEASIMLLSKASFLAGTFFSSVSLTVIRMMPCRLFSLGSHHITSTFASTWGVPTFQWEQRCASSSSSGGRNEHQRLDWYLLVSFCRDGIHQNLTTRLKTSNDLHVESTKISGFEPVIFRKTNDQHRSESKTYFCTLMSCVVTHSYGGSL